MNLQRREFLWYKIIWIILLVQGLFLLFSSGWGLIDDIFSIIFIPLSIISAFCYGWIGWKQKVTNKPIIISSFLFGLAFFIVLIPWLIEVLFNRVDENFLVVIFIWPVLNIVAFLILIGGFFGLDSHQKSQQQRKISPRKSSSKQKRNKII